MAHKDDEQPQVRHPGHRVVPDHRRGFLLQPDPMEGDLLLKTPLPRAARSEFPPGRGMLVAKGKTQRVQLPLEG